MNPSGFQWNVTGFVAVARLHFILFGPCSLPNSSTRYKSTIHVAMGVSLNYGTTQTPRDDHF